MTNYKVAINGKELDVSVLERKAQSITLMIDGARHTVELSYQPPKVISSQKTIHSASAATTPASSPKAQAQNGAIVSPMPGIVVSIKVTKGESIKVGQTVAVIEAMKMENNISSSASGKVKSIEVKAGQELGAGQTLITLEV